jgi:HTH-type transcriptional regulator, cell division transcriptional repressor
MEFFVNRSTSHLTLGQRIQRARSERGFSREALASQTSSSLRAVQLWEKDQRAPRYATLLRLARGLDCSVEWLMTGANPNPNPESERTDEHLQKISD